MHKQSYFFYKAILALSLILVISCGKEDSTSKVTADANTSRGILNGYSVSEPLVKSAVQLLKMANTTRYSTCTGTLIASQYVLTAAHCVEGFLPSQLRFGGTLANFSSGSTVRKISIHPNYIAANLRNDIAVLTLTSPSSVTPLPLFDSKLTDPSEAERYFGAVIAKTELTTVGFGLHDQSGKIDGVLRKGTIILENYINFTDNTLSSRVTSLRLLRSPKVIQEFCGGDSGGPILTKINGSLAIFGINSGSTNPDCLKRANVDLYAVNVPAFIPWIKKVLQGVPMPAMPTKIRKPVDIIGQVYSVSNNSTACPGLKTVIIDVNSIVNPSLGLVPRAGKYIYACFDKYAPVAVVKGNKVNLTFLFGRTPDTILAKIAVFPAIPK